MAQVVVWALVLSFRVGYAGAPLVIDNIASQQDCVAVARELQKSFQGDNEALKAKCVPVRKLVH